MRTHGNLTRWNDERGFGFITTPKGEEIFVHISAFPHGGRPQVGELISYETEVDDRNRTRAIRVMRPGSGPHVEQPRSGSRQPRGARRGRPARSFRSKVAIVVVATLAAYGYSRLADYNNDRASKAPPMTFTEDIPVERAVAAPAFRCDGRTRCPEMRSCEEAIFFLQNCAGTRMDGDDDGIPCEGQWCGH